MHLEKVMEQLWIASGATVVKIILSRHMWTWCEEMRNGYIPKDKRFLEPNTDCIAVAVDDGLSDLEFRLECGIWKG